MFKIFKLGEVCSIESGSRGKGGASTEGIPSIGGEQISSTGYVLTEKMKYITEEHFKKMKQGVIKPDDTLLVKDGATTGKCAFYRNEYKEATVNEHVFILRANNLILPKFLYYVITSDKFQNKIKSNIKGIIGGINLSIKNLEIVIPDKLAEQQEIVQVLDTMNEIIRLREECISHAQDLIPALFQEMFGDVIQNKKNINKIKLGKIFILSSGKFLPAKEMDETGIYPVFGGNGINGYHNEYLFDEPKLCIGRVGVKCGCVHLTKPKSWITDNALYINKLLKPINIIYLKEALTQINLNQYAKRAAQPVISQSTIYNQYILEPPIELQEQFAQKAIEIEAYIKEQQEELENAKQMFQSLLHHAFTGELTSKKDGECNE